MENIVIQHIIPYNVINPSLPILVNICHFISIGYICRIIYSWLSIFISQHSYVFVFLLLNSRYLLNSLLFAFSRCDVMFYGTAIIWCEGRPGSLLLLSWGQIFKLLCCLWFLHLMAIIFQMWHYSLSLWFIPYQMTMVCFLRVLPEFALLDAPGSRQNE